MPPDPRTLPPGRDLDRAVAERVFGRDPLQARHGLHEDGDIEYHWGYPAGHSTAPHYSTDPVADYEVLRHVREKWTDAKSTAFVKACYDLWNRERGTIGEAAWVDYEPGDYSRAALAALAAGAGE